MEEKVKVLLADNSEHFGKPCAATMRNHDLDVITVDKDGKQVLEVENTRLNSQGSQIALTTRFQTMEFANLYIAYESQVAEGGRIETALGGSTEQVAYTPDNRLLTTLSLGEVTPEDTTAPEGDTSETADDDGDKKGCKSMAATPWLLLVPLALPFALKKKD